jgi:hypothetical protein
VREGVSVERTALVSKRSVKRRVRVVEQSLA